MEEGNTLLHLAMHLINLITKESALLLRDRILNSTNLTDGGKTAGSDGKAKKRNKQMLASTDISSEILNAVRNTILANKAVASIAFPKFLYALMANVYDVGDKYSTHVDVPWMGDQFKGWVRADYSFTLFLSSPDSYSGGELVLHGDYPAQIKGNLGQLFLYRSGSPHEVTEVTAGTRVCVVGWIQSFIIDDNIRSACTNLEKLISDLNGFENSASREKAKIILHTLLRTCQ